MTALNVPDRSVVILKDRLLWRQGQCMTASYVVLMALALISLVTYFARPQTVVVLFDAGASGSGVLAMLQQGIYTPSCTCSTPNIPVSDIITFNLITDAYCLPATPDNLSGRWGELYSNCLQSLDCQNYLDQALIALNATLSPDLRYGMVRNEQFLLSDLASLRRRLQLDLELAGLPIDVLCPYWNATMTTLLQQYQQHTLFTLSMLTQSLLEQEKSTLLQV